MLPDSGNSVELRPYVHAASEMMRTQSYRSQNQGGQHEHHSIEQSRNEWMKGIVWGGL